MEDTEAESTQAIDLLKELISFPSLSHEEGPIADFVESHVNAAGLPVKRHENNVYFWLGEGPTTLLLNSHLDVVPPSKDHPHDPFDPVEENGILYGRGAVDAKASCASMTASLLALARAGWEPPNGKVMVALTSCEETGGTYNGLESLRPMLPDLNAALIGEPTNLQPCVAQKGLLILNVTAQGRSAHAARAHLGVNPILKAAQDLCRLEDFTFDREDPILGKPTLAVTVVNGGSARNMVPDTCTFTLDIRSTPAYTHEEIIDLLSDHLESTVEVHSKRIIPVSTPLSASIVKACRTALPDKEPTGSPTASDWIFLHDIPAVKIGPGSSDYSHTAQEQIPVAEVKEAARAYQKIVQAYFTNGST